jgi:hypothetical protein
MLLLNVKCKVEKVGTKYYTKLNLKLMKASGLNFVTYYKVHPEKRIKGSTTPIKIPVTA